MPFAWNCSSLSCGLVCVYKNFSWSWSVLGGILSFLPTSYLLFNPHRLFCVANCKSPHPLRAHLWWHPLGEILIEFACGWGPLTWQVFAQITYWVPVSQTPPVAAASAFLLPLLLLLLVLPLQHISPHLETFAGALPPSVFLAVQVSCCGSSMFCDHAWSFSSTETRPIRSVCPSPFYFWFLPQDYELWSQVLCHINGSVASTWHNGEYSINSGWTSEKIKEAECL